MTTIIEPEFEDEGAVVDEMNCVFEIMRRYEHMLCVIAPLDTLTDAIVGRTLYLMIEYDDCDHLNSPTIDTIRFIRRNIKHQLHKFKEYEKKLEATLAGMKSQAKDDAEFGTHEEQVSKTYRDSKL